MKSATAQERQTAIDLYSSGLSIADVAVRIGWHKSTVRYWFFKAKVEMDKGARISKKMVGRVSPRKGSTHTQAARDAMSRARKGRPSTTLGKIYTEAERENVAAGLRRHYDAKRAANLLLTKEEAATRAYVRGVSKQWLRRVMTMTGHRKNTSTQLALGYTHNELRTHLEAQFKPEMSWENRSSFHVDHKVPIVWFIRNGITDLAVINALSNLQVLTPVENQRKSARIT